MHGHFALTEKGAEYWLSSGIKADTFFRFCGNILGVSLAGSESAMFFPQGQRESQEFPPAGRAAVYPKADKVHVGRVFFKAGIQFHDILGSTEFPDKLLLQSVQYFRPLTYKTCVSIPSLPK